MKQGTGLSRFYNDWIYESVCVGNAKINAATLCSLGQLWQASEKHSCKDHISNKKMATSETFVDTIEGYGVNSFSHTSHKQIA